MAEHVANDAISVLAADITADALELDVLPGTGWRFSDEGTFHIVVCPPDATFGEIIVVGERSEDHLFSLERGAEGTAASEHHAGDIVAEPLTRGVLLALVTEAITAGFRYVHDQPVPASMWHVAHDLGGFPNVTVVDSGGSVVEGDVAYPDDDHVLLSFQAAFGGKAFLS